MKNKSKLVGCIFVLGLFASCQSLEDKADTAKQADDVSEEVATLDKVATATLTAKSGSKMAGLITFTEDDGVVTMNAQLNNVKTPGNHAIHIHEVGDCSSDDGKSAGGHWNPLDNNHGQWEIAPYHLGDIGNIEIDDKGKGSISRKTDNWCIGCGDPNKDIVGKAIVVHQGPDDFSSQPSGAAGARIGCGEIVRQAQEE